MTSLTVCGLDVPVQLALSVEVVERAQHLLADRPALCLGQRPDLAVGGNLIWLTPPLHPY